MINATGGSGLLGTLGGLLTLGGVFNPALGAIGAGLSATDSLINGGDATGALTSLGGALNKLGINWGNPASQNVASPSPEMDSSLKPWLKAMQRQGWF